MQLSIAYCRSRIDSVSSVAAVMNFRYEFIVGLSGTSMQMQRQQSVFLAR
jgi:hypothetical protein